MDFLSKYFLDKVKAEKFVDELVVNDPLLESVCRVPILALRLFFLYLNDKNCFKTSKYRIYSDFLLLDKTNENSKLMAKIMKECFFQLASNRIILDLNQNELIILKNKLDSILRIVSLSDDRMTEIEFFHSSFQEFFIAKFLIDESQKFLFKYKIENYMTKISHKYIFSVMNFIKGYSVELFDRILRYSKYLKKTFNLDKTLLE